MNAPVYSGRGADIKDSGIARRREAAREEGLPSYVAKRAEIVRVSAELFRELGYEGCSLAKIAEHVGLDRVSIYYYVASKEELLRDAVKGITEQNAELGEQILKMEGASAADKIELFVTGLLRSYEKNFPQVFVYILEDMGKITRQRSAWARAMVRQTRRIETIVLDILEEGQITGELRADVPVPLAASALWGMVNWTSRWFTPGGEFDAEATAKSFCQIFLSGMTTADAGGSSRRAG